MWLRPAQLMCTAFWKVDFSPRSASALPTFSGSQDPRRLKPTFQRNISMADSHIEPWLRGALAGIPGPVMPLFFSFAQVREDLQHHAADLTPEQLWMHFPF